MYESSTNVRIQYLFVTDYDRVYWWINGVLPPTYISNRQMPHGDLLKFALNATRTCWMPYKNVPKSLKVEMCSPFRDVPGAQTTRFIGKIARKTQRQPLFSAFTVVDDDIEGTPKARRDSGPANRRTNRVTVRRIKFGRNECTLCGRKRTNFQTDEIA